MEDIKNDTKPKLTQPDSILREFSYSEVLTRLGVEEVGQDLEVAVLDEEANVIPPSMEEEILELLHESQQATATMLCLAKVSITFSGIRKQN